VTDNEYRKERVQDPPLSAKFFERMFDFERLDIYNVLRDLNHAVFTLFNEDIDIDPFIKEQWDMASQSAVLNLVEGTGRIENTDKKHF